MEPFVYVLRYSSLPEFLDLELIEDKGMERLTVFGLPDFPDVIRTSFDRSGKMENSLYTRGELVSAPEEVSHSWGTQKVLTVSELRNIAIQRRPETVVLDVRAFRGEEQWMQWFWFTGHNVVLVLPTDYVWDEKKVQEFFEQQTDYSDLLKESA